MSRQQFEHLSQHSVRMSHGLISPVCSVVYGQFNCTKQVEIRPSYSAVYGTAVTEYSFESLLDDFLNQTDVTFEFIELINPKPDDSDQRGILKDPGLKAQWGRFHESNARLTLMSAEANLRRK